MVNSASQTPVQQVAERVAETAPGLAAAAKALALQDLQQSQASYRQRIADAHKAMARAAGMESVVDDSPEDDMGNIIITGDITAADPAAVVRALSGQQSVAALQPMPSTPAVQPAVTPAATPGWTTLQKAALAAALLGSGGAVGAGIPWALGLFQQPPAVVSPAPATGELSLTVGPAQP